MPTTDNDYVGIPAEDLAVMVRDGQDTNGNIRYELLIRNTGITRRYAKPYRSILDDGEIISIAFIATDAACKSYRQEDGYRYSTVYGYHLRRELIIQANNTTSCPVPMGVDLLYIRYRRLIDGYKAKHNGELPPDDYICNGLGITTAQLSAIKRIATLHGAASLDSTTHDAEGETVGTLADCVPDHADRIADCTDSVYNNELSDALRCEVERLPDAQKQAITAYYMDGAETDKKARQNGLKTLRKSYRLRAWLPLSPVNGTGLERFRESWTSRPEHIAIKTYRG